VKKKRLKELCLKSVVEDKNIENRAKETLNKELHGLQLFFYEIHKALDKGCRKLEIVSPQDSMNALALNN